MLEETFLVINIPKFSFKIKEQVKEPKKTYLLDTGIINALGFKFSENKGRLYENIVCTQLMRMQSQNPELETYYYKDYQGHEADFVIKEKAKIKEIIQVCYNLNDETTRAREIRSLLHASQELKCKNLLIITEEKEGEETISWFGTKRKIKFIPLWKWLLF
jgi:hypothetical protein